jgi:hypothetical protein
MALFLMAKLFAVVVKEFTGILTADATDRLSIAQAGDFPERAPRLPQTHLGIEAKSAWPHRGQRSVLSCAVLGVATVLWSSNVKSNS